LILAVDGWVSLTEETPVATFFLDYPLTLSLYTKGKGGHLAASGGLTPLAQCGKGDGPHEL
jgi:hypothetical protein